MKMKLLPLVAAVSLAVVATAVQAKGPVDGKVYGKINLSLESQDTGINRITKLQNNASRLGFKGKTALQNNISAIYKIEYEVQASTGSSSHGQTLTQRNTYVGLTGDFGTVLAGIHDTPFKSAQGKVDQFNDLDGDFKQVINGEDRKGNTLLYSSPDFNGLSADAAFIAQGSSGKKNGVSIAVKYKMNNLYTALAYNNNVATKGGVIEGHLIRLVGSYSLNDLTIGGIFQQSNPKNLKKENGLMLSAAYRLGENKLKVEFAKSDIIKMGGKQFSIGADHKLGKQTRTFIFFTKLTANGGVSDKYLGLGLEHKF